MKKINFAAIFLTFAISVLNAGDVAVFVDKGFSGDGKSYVFGQYGRTDKKFQGWAEIIQVDLASNDYADGGFFSIKPTSVTADKTGSEVFESLEAKSYYHLKNLDLKKANPDHVLYVCEDGNKKGTDKISFKDFRNSLLEDSVSYSIQLVPTYEGKGMNSSSSFYINVEKKDSEGNTIGTVKVGNPEIKRKGVTGYKIEKIFCDEACRNLVFVVEKMVEDSNGISVRYMIEVGTFI